MGFLINEAELYKFFDELSEKLEKYNKRVAKIGKSTAYISWLEEFTEKYPYFDSETFLYGNFAISDEDFNNVNDINAFFKCIDRYADENYLIPNECEKFFSGCCYVVKYNNYFYRIGVIRGQGTNFYCEKLENIEENYIDFNDILTNKKQDNVDLLNSKLKDLSNLVRELQKLGISKEKIRSAIEEAIS